MKDFAIFILTHGRPDKQYTLDILKEHGYTGKVYLVLDDTDKSIQQYIDNFGAENIIIFNKNHYLNTADVGTNKPTDKCILYAKCACEDISKSLGLKAFVVCDDDITRIKLRVPDYEHGSLPTYDGNFDKLFEYMVDFMIEGKLVGTGFCEQVAFLPGIKVFDEAHREKLRNLRIPYQFIFRNAAYPVEWRSYYGEDDITEMLDNHIRPWYKVPFVQYSSLPTGGYHDTEDGMSETYKLVGDFERTMLYVMYRPDCVMVRTYHVTSENKDIWIKQVRKNNAFPKIISGRFKK